MTHSIQGCYRDQLFDNSTKLVQDCGWRSNQIVNDCNRLLAALMKGHGNLAGVLYLAVGEGLPQWDGDVPQPSPTASHLTNELVRRALKPADIIFLDNSNQPSHTPTSRLEINCQFTGEDFSQNRVQPLREFGLFGGDASEAADSGFMINLIIHPRIDLTNNTTLNRTLRLDFAQGVVQVEELATVGTTLPLQSIDGVGEAYAASLANYGVHSVGDLAEINPLMPVATVPAVKLREFRAKARMVLGFSANLAPFTELAHYNVSDLLKESPEVLAGLIQEAMVTPQMVADLQEELMPLQLALDDRQLKSMTLADFHR